MTSDIAALKLTLGVNGPLMSRERNVEIWNFIKQYPKCKMRANSVTYCKDTFRFLVIKLFVFIRTVIGSKTKLEKQCAYCLRNLYPVSVKVEQFFIFSKENDIRNDVLLNLP